MKFIKTPIVPMRQTFAMKVNEQNELNLEAICIFIATGFFLDNDSYWKDEVCLSPAHNHTIDEQGFLIDSKPWFNWHYSPRDITFEKALIEYQDLLTTIVKEQVGNSQVILPLSGGLDSRSQALILKNLQKPVQAYSYSFKGGFAEHAISKQIADACGFNFNSYLIQPGYLWDSIDELAKINGCYSEFTHPRQMAILNEFKKMNGVFSLGHWGDVLFDRGVPERTTDNDVLSLLFKKMIKPKGLELAEQLWQFWELEGNCTNYLKTRIETALAKIEIDNLSAKVRAFKTSQWAHRWTTTNLSIFQAAHPITLPYYDNKMCEFICTIPEEYLADRRLQIAHLKQNKTLSDITWEAQNPFNLNNYNRNKMPYNLPYRVWSKLQREGKSLFGKPYIQRNWELQFVGPENDKALKSHIFNTHFNTFIPKAIVLDVYNNFLKTDPIHYAHPLSMLLTLSLWNKHFNK
jgi:hypothetical protein